MIDLTLLEHSGLLLGPLVIDGEDNTELTFSGLYNGMLYGVTLGEEPEPGGSKERCFAILLF